MKKILVGILAIVLLAAFVAAKGKPDHLYLYEKENYCDHDFRVECWTLVEDGAWGKMMYMTDKFVFNGHHLTPETEYSLIAYQDPWNGAGSLELGKSYSDEYGDVHIMGELPEELPSFAYSYGEYGGMEGSKVWLVPTADLPDPELGFSVWNPEMYLFEDHLI